jgi:hypothetical protein
VAEGTRLLSGRRSKAYRGFESLPLRNSFASLRLLKRTAAQRDRRPAVCIRVTPRVPAVLGPFGSSAPRDLMVARGSHNRHRLPRDDTAKPVRIPPSPQMPPPVALRAPTSPKAVLASLRAAGGGSH